MSVRKRVKGWARWIDIRVSLVSGRCRWCGCTYENGCGVGCGWVDRAQTLCTACEPLDCSMRTAGGRRQLAAALQEYDFEALGQAMPAAARPGHRARR